MPQTFPSAMHTTSFPPSIESQNKSDAHKRMATCDSLVAHQARQRPLNPFAKSIDIIANQKKEFKEGQCHQYIYFFTVYKGFAVGFIFS